MNLEKFCESRKADWDRLRQTTDLLYDRGTQNVNCDRVLELVHLYREASADLARLRTVGGGEEQAERLNRTLSRAHGLLYRETPRDSFSIWDFFSREFPRLFRETWKFHFASLVCSIAFFLISFGVVFDHPDIAADVMGGMEQEFSGQKTPADIQDRFQKVSAPILSSLVTTNNIKVALNAFAFGITFGIGTVYILIVNGTMLGGLAGAFALSGVSREFWLTILPHGALELSAIVVAGGAGLVMGYALWVPGRETRVQSLKKASLKSLKITIGLIPAFMVAGFMEGFVTPNMGLPQEMKALIGIVLATAFWLYVLTFGKRPA